MKKVSKLFILLVFIALSGICKSQTFTAYELISLAHQDQEQLKSTLQSKGYTYSKNEDSDMSTNHVFKAPDNMTISVISPNFEGAEKLISWEFHGNDNLYNKLEKEFIAEGYKRADHEVRNGGRYTSATYQRQGNTVTLSRDKTKDTSGVYRVSVRCISPILYQKK